MSQFSLVEWSYTFELCLRTWRPPTTTIYILTWSHMACSGVMMSEEEIVAVSIISHHLSNNTDCFSSLSAVLSILSPQRDPSPHCHCHIITTARSIVRHHLTITIRRWSAYKISYHRNKMMVHLQHDLHWVRPSASAAHLPSSHAHKMPFPHHAPSNCRVKETLKECPTTF